MKLINLETENFRVTTDEDGQLVIKATDPLAKAYVKLKKMPNPQPFQGNGVSELFERLEALETGVAKLAAI